MEIFGNCFRKRRLDYISFAQHYIRALGRVGVDLAGALTKTHPLTGEMSPTLLRARRHSAGGTRH